MNLLDIREIVFESTSHCNAKCPHCARFDQQGNLHPDLELMHIDPDQVIDNLQIDQLTNLNRVALVGDKGDPAMNPGIEKFIAAFDSAPSQPFVALSTNGGIRSTDWWYRLGQYKNLQVMFSIDGLEDTNHLYRIGVDYAKALANAEAYIAGGGTAVWRFLIFKHNQHQLSEARTLARKLGFREFQWRHPDHSRFLGQQSWPVTVQGKLLHYLSPSDKSTVSEGRAIYKSSSTFPPHAFDAVPSKLCPWSRQGRIYVNYQSKVIPCCMMHFDTALKYPGTEHFEQLCGGFDQQDLTQHSLSKILTHDLFGSALEHSLRSGQRHVNCDTHCKQQLMDNMKNDHTD